MAFPPTDWLDWTTAEYDVGAPATSLSFERWFRDPVALAQGAPGAPRINIKALQELTAGDVVRSRQDAEVSNTTFASVTMFTFMQRGTVRLKAAAKASGGGPSTMKFFRSRNGVITAVASWSDVVGGYQNYSADITVLPGDTVSAESRCWFSGNVAALTNVRVCTAGENLYPTGAGVFVENDYA